MLPSGATSQVPRPLTTATIANTASSRRAPSNAIRRPSITNGIVLPSRWANPTCRKGAVTMPSRPSGSRASIPYWSSWWSASTSTTSTAHITATSASRIFTASLTGPNRILGAPMATRPDQQPSIAPIVGPDDARRFTDSGIEVKHVYHDDDVAPSLDDRLGEPGDYPFTRGIHPDMYRGIKSTERQYAGYATAAETNQRFRYLIEHGSTGLSMAFDLPTQL